MSIATETQVQDVLALVQMLSGPDRDRLLKLLRREPDEPLPERASLDEAIELYLAEACGIGRAAELAGVTRWDVIDRLKERGLSQVVPDFESVEEMDAKSALLRREGYL
jgi:hypothetical protein